MVKGTSKRVVVVKSPDPKVFEQAIFIVREDFLSRRGDAHRNDVLREAQDVADQYIRSTVLPAGKRGFWRAPPVFIAAVGAILAAVVWTGLRLFGVI